MVGRDGRKYPLHNPHERSELGELLEIDNSWMRFRLSIRDNSNLNDYTGSGIYGLGYNNISTITNGPGFSWGVMLGNRRVTIGARGRSSPSSSGGRHKPPVSRTETAKQCKMAWCCCKCLLSSLLHRIQNHPTLFLKVSVHKTFRLSG